MEQRRLEWKVGVFVLIGLVLLAVLLLQLGKGASLFRTTYNLHLTAKNVGGLKPRAAVLIAGVQVGSISEIKLNPDGKDVAITLQIGKQYPIYKDARFVIEQSGFLGDQYVAVVPRNNEGPVFQPDDHAIAEDPLNLQEVARSAQGFIVRIDETAKKLNEAISDVRRLLLNEKTLTNISAAAHNMRAASERAMDTVNDINTLVETNAPSIGLAVSNVVFFSEQINQFAGKFGGVLTTNSADISAAVKNIESSTVVMKELLDDLQSGKGLAGNVLKNDALANDFRAIAGNLSVTTSNLNRLGLWGILWSKKPPKTNSPPVYIEPVEVPKRQF